MKAVYDALYYDLTLKTVGLGLGALLIVAHLLILLKRDSTQAWLKALPRNEGLGMWILAIDFAWCFLVWSEMDLGEFINIKKSVQVGLVIGFLGFGFYVREFLAVRAIGLFLILLACPVLNAAFLQPPVTRLLLVFLAYAWIIKGMFYVGMPYLMRDGIDWVLTTPSRLKMAAMAGLVYGMAVLICAVLFY
ncbi:MAG: hypothetical protein L3J39_07810 [Verrucomicrobiales bacterium]|nr:hypothetical protein [Verrucomicrobiales bacterium]